MDNTETLSKYELVLIVDAKSTSDSKEAIRKEAADLINKHGGKVINSQVWLEKHKMTFQIKKCDEGTYFLINFENLRISDPDYDSNDWSKFLNATLIQVDDPSDLKLIEPRMENYRILQNQVQNDWAISSFAFEQLANAALDVKFLFFQCPQPVNNPKIHS